MDPLDLVMKAIIGVTRNYGKKVLKKDGPAPEIEQVQPSVIEGPQFNVGFSREEIMPVQKEGKTLYIAGHGSGHVMEDILTTAYVSASWIDCGADKGMLWLSVDCVGMTRIEINKIRSMIMDSEVISGCQLINISASHSHSGVDTLGYWGKPFLSIPADGKDQEYMDMLMKKAVKAAEDAYLNRKPGKLYTGRIEIKDGLRAGRKFEDKHEFLTRLRFVPDDGTSETWIMNFGGHPNTLGGGNRKFSGEYPYYMREKISEANGANVVFGIGAIGGMDVKHFNEEAMDTEEGRIDCVKNQGYMVADAALSMTDDRELTPVIKYIQQPFYYPVDNYVLTFLAIRHTMSFKAYSCPDSLTGIAMESEMTYMIIGDQKILLLPGENFVNTVYGSYTPAERSSTGEGPEVNPQPLCEICGDPEIIEFGVTNDMTGYVVPPNDFVLNKTQPFLNSTHDRFDDNHYHETNSMGINSQKVIADNFKAVVERM